MTRQIVLDTETTGLEPQQGHRIIEIGCVELIDRKPTGNDYHVYLQPDREIDAGAVEVHGISNEFLQDKPRFADICDDFIAYIKESELIIHNAAFDVGFIDAELMLIDSSMGDVAGRCEVFDTLELARKLHPGQKNNLDALCKRYEVDNSGRELHGALLDARILADVYLAMTGGQTSLLLAADSESGSGVQTIQRVKRNGSLPVIKANEEELAAHNQHLSEIDAESGGNCLWLHESMK